MPAAPELAEIAATVARMEARFDATPEAADLMAAYRRMSRRFAADLSDPRDLVAKSAALMMVGALAPGTAA